MGYGETRGMGNRLQWRATVDRVDANEETVVGVSTAESNDSFGFQGKGRQVDGVKSVPDRVVDRLTAVEMSQGVYLSTEMAKMIGMEGVQVVDRVSTEGLGVDGMSTEEGAPGDEALAGEEGEQ